MTEIIQHREHSDYKYVVDFLETDKFAPEYFDIETINALLQDEDYGYIYPY